MVIAWSGHGYVVPTATFVFSLATEYLTETIYRDENYYQKQSWPLSLALLAAAALCYTLGNRLNATVADPHSQPTLAPPEPTPGHTFLFVRMEYWGIALAGAAVVVFLSRSFG